jgi:hypothetical protein
MGFSPLKQIDRGNVSNLRVAWSWSLPPGASEVTPLVHYAVLFVYGWGDRAQAGRGYRRPALALRAPAPKEVQPGVKRNLAILW